jgi:hypothetical protein
MARKISEEEEARALPAGAEPISRRRETKNSLVDDRSMQLAGAAMDVVCTALTAGKWDHRSRRGGEGEARAVGDDEPRGGGRYRSRVARGGVSEGSSGAVPKPTSTSRCGDAHARLAHGGSFRRHPCTHAPIDPDQTIHAYSLVPFGLTPGSRPLRTASSRLRAGETRRDFGFEFDDDDGIRWGFHALLDIVL